MMLGDLGADVIKVERVGTGDESRGWGPPFDDRGEAAYYLSTNRNKLSVAADLNDAADQELIRTLAMGADVVVENFNRGTLERRGLGADELLTANPKLIWCTISGFGADSDRPGYDFVVQAEAGWMSITGEPNGAPMKVGVALADVIAGKDAAALILAALVARANRARSSLRSRRLNVSLEHSAKAALVNVAQNAIVSGHDARRWGNAHANLVPYELFNAADGALVIAAGSDAQWQACARALGLDDLAADESLRTNTGRLAQRTRVVRAIGERVREHPVAHWMALLDQARVPCGRVKSIREALAGVEVSSAAGVFPAPPGRVRFPAPRLDEHGELVRRRGWDAFSSLSV